MRLRTKYGNQPVVIDGIRFASKAEGFRWRDLQLLERAGQITELRRQPRYDLRMDGMKIAAYVGDFEYVENGRKVCEDVKGYATREFAIKSKIFQHLYPDIELRVIR